MSASARRTDSTERVELPPDETGPVPISISRTEPRWFGVTPPLLAPAIALALVVVAVALLATGSWPVGLLLLGAGALFLAACLESARRRRHTLVARVSVDVRERASSTWESLRARFFAAVETKRIHNALAVLSSRRRDELFALGRATHGGDEDAAATARERLAELDAREQELRSLLELQLADAGERIRKARLSVQETLVAPRDDSDEE
jgi:uncharacterized membrane protein